MLTAVGTAPILAVLLAVGGADAASSARPDLRITSGKVTGTGTTLIGSVVVRNAGRRAAAATSVALQAHRQGRSTELRRFAVRALRARRSTTVRIRTRRGALRSGTYSLRACADARSKVKERSERNNCRTVGTLVVTGPVPSVPTPAPVPAPDAPPAPAPAPGTAPYAPPGTPAPCATPACRPLSPLTVGDRIALSDPAGTYWAYVPSDYPTDHSRPVRLLVWLHGCGGESAGDIYNVADYWPETDYVAIAPDGAEGGCWNTATHPSRVFTAINDAVSRFNIDLRRVIIGGYSSGGDLSYRTALENPRSFAGVLVHNTSPFRDTGRSADAYRADVTARGGGYAPRVFHLHNTADGTYPIAGVRSEIDQLRGFAGFGDRVTLQEQPGGHYEPTTDADVQTTLVRGHMDDDWQAPAG